MLKHPSLTVGSTCPCCAQADTFGKLGIEDDPQEFVRLTGGPLITGTRFIAPILRCHYNWHRRDTGLEYAFKKSHMQ